MRLSCPHAGRAASRLPRSPRWIGLLVLAAGLLPGCPGPDRVPDSTPRRTAPVINLTVPEDSRVGMIEVRNLDSRTLTALERLELDRRQWEQVLRVAIHEDTVDARGEIPPVLGSYEVADTLIRFTPMFPFDPGQNYVVTFDPSPYVDNDSKIDLPVLSIVGLPLRSTTPRTRAVQVYPTADIVPENLLRAYIHFSAPMSAGNGLPYVKLLDEAGEEVASAFLPLGDVLGAGLWDRQQQRYTLFFDPGRIKRGLALSEELGRPVTEGLAYTLVIDEGWLDAGGNPLVEGFQKQFRVGPAEVEPIQLSRWKLSGPPERDTREPVLVSFPEPLDHGLLNRALSVTTLAGDPIEGRIEVSNAETQWAFVPRRAWEPGEYSIRVYAFLEDLAGNRIGAPFEITAPEPGDEGRATDFFVVPFLILR